jgi:magnesium transporter
METAERVWPKNSVGEMIDPYFLSFPQTSTVKDAVETIRFLANNKLTLNYAYVVDDRYRLVGVLNMRDLLYTHDDDLLENVMQKSVFAVNARRDREEVANEAREKRFIAIPVVDDENHLLGTLKLKDLISVVQQEATEDIQKMFGASGEEKATSPVHVTVRTRLPWLQVNLLTAFLASAVIALFEGTIARITALAVFLPIVASQGGNAGAQSLAVVMRALALNEISFANARAVILKETLAGALNGAAVGVVTGLVTLWWNGNPLLGVIIGCAMLGNMILAGFFGAAIPLVMKRVGFDPAQCSNIILTTFTDVCGFLLFLGLAVLFESRLA